MTKITNKTDKADRVMPMNNDRKPIFEEYQAHIAEVKCGDNTPEQFKKEEKMAKRNNISRKRGKTNYHK